MESVAVKLFIFCSFLAISYGKKESSPVLFWTNKLTAFFPEQLSGHTVSSESFHSDFLKKLSEDNDVLIVFLQDQLSLDDITQNADVYSSDGKKSSFSNLKGLMEKYTSGHLTSVANPEDAIQTLTDEFKGQVHRIDGTKKLSDLTLAKGKKNVVLVDLPDSRGNDKDHLSKIDDLIGSMTNDISGSGTQFAAVYTSKRSVQSPNEKFYIGRHLLEDTEEKAYPSVVAVGGCIMFYAKNISLTVTKSASKSLPTPAYFPLGNASDVTPSCRVGNNSAKLLVKYSGGGLPSNLTVFQFEATFSNSSSQWKMNEILITYTGSAGSTSFSSTEMKLDAGQVGAPSKFSYHCSGPNSFKPKNETGSSDEAFLHIKEFQVQYNGGEKANLTKFGDPDDCVGFFTLPIWSGLITMFVLTLIFAYGVVMLASITTMDRFDDPKGKTIQVHVPES